VSHSGAPQTLVRRAIAACAAVVAASAIAACGGGDDSGPTPDFPSVADDICLDTARQLANARAGAQPPSSAKDAAELLDTQIPVRLDGLDRLHALEPPPELLTAWNQYLEITEDRINALDDALSAAEDADEDAYVVAQSRAERLADKSRQVAEQVGLETCAEILPPAGQQDVLAAVEKLETSQDANKVCNEVVTERFAETVFGSVEKCESQRGVPTVVSLDLLDVGGVGSTSAFVDVKVTDFFGAVRQQRIELVFDSKSETWKVDYREPLVNPEENKPAKNETAKPPTKG
jgi:hypothetical protein